MKILQYVFCKDNGWDLRNAAPDLSRPQLILVFGSGKLLHKELAMAELHRRFPEAQIVGCSTAGEICGTRVHEESLVATCIQLDQTRIQTEETSLAGPEDSALAGKRLAHALSADDLAHVFVLSDGLNVNGSELVRGLTENLPAAVGVTGGLSADGSDFKQTLVYCNGSAEERRVVAVGFYGRHLRVGYGSLGGWDAFGPERKITRAQGNVLMELDGEPALALYKRYLGPLADGLPAVGLRFPLSVRPSRNERPVVRTILGINEQYQSLTFAGDVPQGHLAQLMRANFDRLIDGATKAATASQIPLRDRSAELAILISCVGRRLILQQRTEEEVEGVRNVLGPRPALTGFYSYGEISPFTPTARCELHNQTMTITVFAETE